MHTSLLAASYKLKYILPLSPHWTHMSYLFSQVSLVPQVESSGLHKKHHNIDSDGHKLVVGSKGLILQIGRNS